ncbi:LytTR family DNA-binding domain-containing protein, partial [uncultured Holdemanella sp.]|uniref:LytR/AlgR family response regulator transcription factor n=1 Tax=uncultured Holdemanella sp. TaxID=1763549 RepID=UPI00258A3192
MLNVLIIDDDLKDSKDVEKLCIHYFNKRNIDYKISVELKLNENLDILSNVDILFLDVEIGNDNGIEFSKKLRKVYPELMIIITSKYSQYLIDGYSVDAKRYFLKPIDENIFNEEMENVLGATFQ